MGRVDGKVIIITGAASGFGRATAKLMAKEGAKIVVADYNLAGAEETVTQINAEGGEAVAVKVNVTSSDEVKAMINLAVEKYGKLDVLFNNAGVQGDCDWDIGHMPESEFDRYIAVDLKGVWLGCHHAAAEIVKSKGCIINTASVAAYKGLVGCSNYGPAKAGVRNLTAVVANELGRFGVRCNSISPYVADTPGLNIDEKSRKINESGNPLSTLIDPMCVAYTALFLASDESKCVTGTDILVDAGHVTQAQPTDFERFYGLNVY